MDTQTEMEIDELKEQLLIQKMKTFNIAYQLVMYYGMTYKQDADVILQSAIEDIREECEKIEAETEKSALEIVLGLLKDESDMKAVILLRTTALPLDMCMPFCRWLKMKYNID